MSLTTELQNFGISSNFTSEGIDRVLRTAMRKGGSLAELFFEETVSTRVFYEEGKVDRIMEGTDRGAGLRVIFENRSVYGYTTELTEQSLVQLAETLSEAVTAKELKPWNKSIEWIKTRQPADIAQYKIGRDPAAPRSPKKSKSPNEPITRQETSSRMPARSLRSCSTPFAKFLF